MQNTPRTQRRGLCLLSLDGGGIRGISELVILEEIMKRVQKAQKLTEPTLPCDYFDLICGTSTGGLIAILLGRLRMSVPDAMDHYRVLAKTVFSERKAKGQDGVYKKSKLEGAIQGVVDARLGPGRGETEGMLEHGDNGGCKTFVCAVPASHINRVPRLFRTYPVDRNEEDDCKIWEASRATSAAPYLFKRIQIGKEGMKEDFIDAGMGCNNPVKQLIGEAEQVFGEDKDVACIVSIGTGKPKVNGFKKPSFGWQRIIPIDLVKVLKQMATDSEATAGEMRMRYKNCPGVYYRLNVEDGLDRIKLEEWESMGDVRTHTKDYLNQPDVSQEIDKIVTALVGIPFPQYTLRQLGSSLPGPDNHQMFLYPRGISHFVARRHLLAAIEDCFRENEETLDPTVIIILGMGGSGKTQLALEYCRRTEESRKYDGIFWVDASSPDSIARSFVQIQELVLGTKGEPADPDASISKVTDAMSRWTTPWLIVFDNFDQLHLFDGRNVSDYFPRGKRGAILFTSRDKNTERIGHTITATEMSEDEGLILLLRRFKKETISSEDRTVGGHILRRLGYLALAIDQAGAYISARNLALPLFMDHFNHRREIVLSETPALWEYRKKLGHAERETSVSAFTTWEMSFEQIKGDEIARRDKEHLLTVSAFFDRRDIFEDLFKSYFADSTPAWMAMFSGKNGSWSKFNFGDVLAELKRLSLLELERLEMPALGAQFSLHPLIQDWLKLRASGEASRSYAVEAIKIISAFLTASDITKMTLQARRTTVSHMKEAFENESSLLDKTNGLDTPDLRFAAFSFATLYLYQGEYEEAEKLYRSAANGWEMLRGPEDPDTLRVVGSLATLLNIRGNHVEAEKLYKRVLDGMRMQLGEDHIDTIHTLHNLAIVHRHNGQLEEAERLFRHVLEFKEKKLGPNDDDTQRSVESLGKIYQFQGKYEDAERLYERVLETSQSEHGATLRRLHDLASVYECQNRHQDAEQLFMQVIAESEKQFGPEHPSTLSTKFSLAVLFKSQGRKAEAEELLKRVLAGAEGVFGAHSRNTIKVVQELASEQRLYNQLNY